MRADPDAKMKGVLELIPFSDASTMQKVSWQFGRHGIEVPINSVSGDWRWIEILGGHQSRIRKICDGNFGKLQAVHFHRNCNSAGRKF